MMDYIDRSNVERNKSMILEASREDFFNDHRIIGYNNTKMQMQNILNELYNQEMILIDSLETEINKELQKCNV